MLTKDVISFEQPGPGLHVFITDISGVLGSRLEKKSGADKK